jgi:hypothetical protein
LQAWELAFGNIALDIMFSGASTEEPPKIGRAVTQRVKVSPSALFSEEGLEQGESVVETERTMGEANNGERTVEMVQSSFGTGEKVRMLDGPA